MLLSANLSLQQEHKLLSESAAGNRSFMQDTQYTACISLICLPFHKDMHHDYHQGIQTA